MIDSGGNDSVSSTALPWWALTGVTAGVVALLTLVAIAAATPIDAQGSEAGLRISSEDLQLRWAALAIVVMTLGAMFAAIVHHARRFATAERKVSKD